MRDTAGSWLEGKSATEYQKMTIWRSSSEIVFFLKKTNPTIYYNLQTKTKQKPSKRQDFDKYSDLNFSSILTG